jgi:hypothetical protein
MAALPSSPSSIPRSTHSHLCTSDLHSPLIVFAWSRRESVMLEVRYPALCRGRSAVKSIFPSSGNPSEVSKKCLQEVQTISCATLFAPVLRVEAVQAMSAWVFYALVMFKARSGPIVLVSGWSDNGWLSGGHAVRMALELCESLTFHRTFMTKYNT